MAFALVAAAIVARPARSWWVRAVAVGYPLLIVAVTLLTYNHFRLDAVASAAVTAVAAGAVALARPRRVGASSLGCRPECGLARTTAMPHPESRP